MKELEDMRNDELFTIVVAGIQILRENERKQGYEDGKADTPFTDTEEAEKKAYNRGLNEAWDAARKIAQTYAHFTCYDLNMIFGDRDSVGRKMIFEEYTPQDAIRKIKEYEDKQKQDAEIKVGYEVYNLDRDNKLVVTAIDGNKAIQLCSNGKYTVDDIDTLHWTGREDLRIKKVLEKITNEV